MWSSVLCSPGSNSSSSILNELQLFNGLFGKSVTVVCRAGNKGMDFMSVCQDNMSI